MVVLRGGGRGRALARDGLAAVPIATAGAASAGFVEGRAGGNMTTTAVERGGRAGRGRSGRP